MRINKILVVVIASVMFFGFSACKKDLLTPVCDGSQPTYDTEIKPIIDATCAISGCHNSGSNKGELTTYAEVEPYLLDGSFRSRVLEKQNMPQGSVLTQVEIDKIQCWFENDFAEN